MLALPGYPTCRHVEDGERAFFTWFVADTFSTVEPHAQLQAAFGLCPRHPLAVLGWELRKPARKGTWACCYEPPGPERDLWRRAMAHIDRRVFKGAPAPGGA